MKQINLDKKVICPWFQMFLKCTFILNQRYMNSKKHLYIQLIEQQKQDTLRKSMDESNKNVSPKKIK